MMPTFLITGGLGYLGSHMTVRLLGAGYRVLVLDSLVNSKIEIMDRINDITGMVPELFVGDIRDSEVIYAIFNSHKIDTVIHFAGLKSVADSLIRPHNYYDVNINGSLNLLRVMRQAKVKKIIFSSSATVYGDPEFLPVAESHPVRPKNPYGMSKYFVELFLDELYRSDSEWRIVNLRYFNPVGAHPSGIIGEDPVCLPQNLFPAIGRVLKGADRELAVYGDDYKTHDGSGVRDYIHVQDLIDGHFVAFKSLNEVRSPLTLNLGTGIGYSVIDVINSFDRVTGKTIKYCMRPARAGDVAICYADPTESKKILGWSAKYGLDKMCEDYWRWIKARHNT